MALAVAPGGGPLFEEGAHAFLGILGLGGGGHEFDGVGVGVVLAHFDLGVEAEFADSFGEGGAAGGSLEEVEGG